MKDFIAKAQIEINVPIARVWEALITPEIISKYLFGTKAISDFKEGSPIIYQGSWQGKEYEDKGKILKVIPNKLFVSTYWSSMAGTQDLPENYANVTYKLSQQNGKTKIILTQDNNKTEDNKNHSQQNWTTVLESLKKVLETDIIRK